MNVKWHTVLFVVWNGKRGKSAKNQKVIIHGKERNNMDQNLQDLSVTIPAAIMLIVYGLNQALPASIWEKIRV